MMKRKNDRKSFRVLRRTFLSAIVMLLISSIMLTVTGYAWLTMATAPEVSGIATNVTANGALEIALLNAETKLDPSKVQTIVGASLANGNYLANYTWGNLLNLSFDDFGLNQINLSPARLQISKNGDQFSVGGGILDVPIYGYDGRIMNLEHNAISATYKDSMFLYTSGAHDFGVRAIGTSNAVTAQAAALSIAKSNINSYMGSAKTTAKNALGAAVNDLLNLIIDHYADSTATYDDADKTLIYNTLISLEKPFDYIDDALRYGLVAFAASEIEDEDTFDLVRTVILSDKPLSDLMALEEAKDINFPSEFITWVAALESTQEKIVRAKDECNLLTGGVYTWEQIKKIMNYIINFDGDIFINETKKFSDMSANDFTGLMGKAFTMTLTSGSGIFADISDFTGNYSAYISAMGSDVTVETFSSVNPSYLAKLSTEVSGLSVENNVTSAELTSMYGYAIDMAFRTNAHLSNLLLQTEAAQRVHESSNGGSTMGGGSYMEFSTKDKNFTHEQIIRLMDAVRVAFIDELGTVYGIAKLNTSNSIIPVDGFYKAPLYLYDFSISEDPQTNSALLIMGERRKADNTITSLEPNTPKVITAVVWLDGDIVDNTMVSAEEETSLSGVLNLQFASSADLIPADNKDLQNVTPDKGQLEALITASDEIFSEGQGLHTTVSWNNFVRALEYARNVSTSGFSNDYDVYRANQLLTIAKGDLAKVSVEELGNRIQALRDELLGKTSDLAFYVVLDQNTGKYVNVNPHTMEQADKAVGQIYRVDYDKNLRDEGNGVMTPIYTDASWSNLAAALYEAELVHGWNNKTFEAVDAAITALDAAYEALEFRVYFIPYDYNGALYYYAIPGDPSTDADTYGSWYDTNFKRIVSDLMIYKLDAYAEMVDIAKLVLNEYYISSETDQLINPYVEILDDIYPELSDEEILAINWSASNNTFTRAITPAQIAYLKDLIERANAVSLVDGQVTAAQELLNRANSNDAKDRVSESWASLVIESLAPKVIAAEEDAARKEQEDTDAAHDPTTAPMTLDQRTVLTAAVSAAKAISGYDEAENTDLNDLRTAVAAVEALLSSEAGVTEKQADDALTALNTLMVAAGGKEVTEYNTILHTIPVGSEIKEVVNTVDFNANFYTSGLTGEDELSAVVLTKHGIVINLSKKVEVYAPAKGINLYSEYSTNLVDWSGVMYVGDSKTVHALLHNVPDCVGEKIAEYTWFTDDTGVELDVAENGYCTITAVDATDNYAYVTLIVKTVQGNTYTETLEIRLYDPVTN